MKSKHEILNNWKTWIYDYGTQNAWTDKYKGVVYAELSKEVDWMLRQKDADLEVLINRRLAKYRAVITDVGQIAGHDRMGAWRMALWDWCLQ
jgi:hypothetical protein